MKTIMLNITVSDEFVEDVRSAMYDFADSLDYYCTASTMVREPADQEREVFEKFNPNRNQNT